MRGKYLTISTGLTLCCLFWAATLCACVQMPRRNPRAASFDSSPAGFGGREADASRVNINTASREELERLPGIGPALASRIVEHRGRYGPFRRAEHLVQVRGMSDARLRELLPLIEAG